MRLCKQLNGSILKSLKPSYLGQNQKEKKVFRAVLGPKFCVSFQGGPGSIRNFNFPFKLVRARVEIPISLSGRAGLGPKFRLLLWAGRARAEIFFLYFEPGRAGSGLKNPACADL